MPGIVECFQDSDLTVLSSIFLGEVTNTGSLKPLAFGKRETSADRKAKQSSARQKARNSGGLVSCNFCNGPCSLLRVVSAATLSTILQPSYKTLTFDFHP
jgi:hypothetical protein